MKNLRNRSNLTQRIVAALIGAPIVIFLIFYHPLSFLFLVLALTALTQYELYRLIMLQGNLPLKSYGTFCGTLIVLLTYLIETYTAPPEFYYIVVPFLTLPFFIKLYRKRDKHPFANLGYTYLGIIYVALPFALLVEMTFWRGNFLPLLPLGTLLILWSFDVAAYFSGKYFGKRKLFERISPKKTWEGFFGGAIFALITSFFYWKFTESLPLWQWMSIAGIIVVAGTLGDLVESLFKRSIEIKDSGSIIPGHGGFLDRFDGLLLSMPFIVTFIKIFEKLF
ncbi:phosphatidate cytidylyltransferase [Leadbetterella byssophila]|jgi:phosphatidate cytidylyltransferase|uniref:Phosphatidate cytidylyltransferase n=1 Tax=Leadbetterella byssophila (strain DSM 17132 / JCM 16389 / KACC 11308 / NBRC 106382 / 4M15) TaxID=649349 RepID=E4RVY3_LEAB4|nr:phosphatidate cytidylyltransferase [Leadbetterella byssophila]ADQ18893.1 phosphatidate cytidylyltransferase [Leadbetterella byssophila DSM 17132]